MTAATILAEAVELGLRSRSCWPPGGYPGVLGEDLTVASDRVYPLDDGGTAPSVPPNHVFMKSGADV